MAAGVVTTEGGRVTASMNIERLRGSLSVREDDRALRVWKAFGMIVTRLFQEDLAMHDRTDTLWSTLSPREQQVALRLARGETCAEIGEAIGCSPKTADTHRGRVLKKLGLRNAAELARAWVAREIRKAGEVTS